MQTFKLTLRMNDDTLTRTEHFTGNNGTAYARLLEMEAQAIKEGHRIEDADYAPVLLPAQPAPLTMTKIVAQQATFTMESSCYVDVEHDAEGEEQVAIWQAGDREPLTVLRHDDRDRFLKEAYRLAEESGFDSNTGMLAAAKPYIESIA